MADVAIKKKPTVTPNVSAPKRGTGGARSLTVKWSVGAWCKKGTREDRIEGFRIEFYLYCTSWKNPKNHKTLHYIADSSDPNRTEWILWLTNFKCGKTTYTRESFYPFTDWCLRSVKVTVKAKNRKGFGPWSAATMSFGKPRTPSISMSQNPDTGDVSFTVKHNKGEDHKEIWNTEVWYSVWDSSQKKTLERDFKYFGTNEAEHTYSTDVADRMGKAYGQYTCVTVTAKDRGLWGRGDEAQRKLYIGWPKQPSVTVEDPPSRGLNEKVTIRVSTKSSTEFPVTGVRLEKLVNCDYERASQIPGDADWQECGAVDDGNCKALSATVAELTPEAGKHTWVRVKSWNQVESIFYVYSTPQRVRALDTTAPTAADDTVKIVELLSGDDGESAVVTLAWDKVPAPGEEDHHDDSDGTEVSWSTDKNAWRSTTSPQTFDVTYDDGQYIEGEGQSAVTWRHSAVLHIADLEQGKPVYVRARRYMEGEDSRSFGPYYPDEGDKSVTPTTSPTSATLVVPASVPRGQSLAASWTFDGGGEQSEWQLMAGPATRVEVEEEIVPEQGEPYTITVTKLVLDGEMAVVERGTDALGACVVPAERIEGLLDADGSIALAVRVSTGGTPVQSDAVLVSVADPPTLAVEADDVTAQPLALDVTCTSEASLSVVVSSAGSSVSAPDGTRLQVEGDQVWSQAFKPEWSAEQQADESVLYVATVTAPEGLPLVDDSTYHVRVVATDADTGLESEPAECDMAVAYARKAPEPSEAITVTPYDVVDPDSGARVRGCTIEMTPPTGGVETDVYDLYRVTPDGTRLVAEGLLTDAVVDDPYAPFGSDAELAYCVSCRTVDGCEQKAEYPYELEGDDLRIDFEGPHGPSYVELPYNLVGSDAWEKDFEARVHLDGSVGGYWAPGVVRRASLSTDLIRVEDEQTKRAVMELAASAGACWVRTPVGQAYEADVQVRSYGTLDYENAALPVTLDATEVTRTGFGATVAPTDEDGETEPDEPEEETEPGEE